MGESDETLPIAEAQKHARQSFVKAKQRHLLHHPLILGESLGHPVEHLFAKSGIIGLGIVKRLGGNHAPGHISLDHTFGAVMIAVDQTPECLQANPAGADAKHHLAPIRSGQADPDNPCFDDQKTGAGRTRLEQDITFGRSEAADHGQAPTIYMVNLLRDGLSVNRD